MNSKIVIIISVVLYSIINTIRIWQNVKNKDLLVNIYPEHIKAKWQKVYANPKSFIFQRLLLRMVIIAIFLYFLFVRQEDSFFINMLIGIVYYISFVTVFDETRALISQEIAFKKIKEEEINKMNSQEVYLSLMIIFPLYVLVGFVPLLFLLIDFQSMYIGCLIGGCIYIIINAWKLIKARPAAVKD